MKPDTPSSALRQLERKLLSQLAEASAAFHLLEPDDRVMVAVSGGKDSLVLLYLLRQIQRRAPFPFEVCAVHLDQGHPGHPVQRLRDYFEQERYAYRIVTEDTYSIVQEKVPSGKTYCSLCSRLRRGILYNVAEEMAATKLALGHHRDDSLETLLLNLFYSGQLKAMPARLRSDDGRNTVIRPLIYSAEQDIAQLAEELQLPVIPCNLCGSQENLKRQEIKQLLATLETRNPKLKGNMLAALHRVCPTHLLDPALLGETQSKKDFAEGSVGHTEAPAASQPQLIPLERIRGASARSPAGSQHPTGK